MGLTGHPFRQQPPTDSADPPFLFLKGALSRFFQVQQKPRGAGAGVLLAVDLPLKLPAINPDLVEVMIDGGVPQHFPDGCMSGGGLRHQRCKKKRANNCIFHWRIIASN